MEEEGGVEEEAEEAAEEESTEEAALAEGAVEAAVEEGAVDKALDKGGEEKTEEGAVVRQNRSMKFLFLCCCTGVGTSVMFRLV